MWPVMQPKVITEDFLLPITAKLMLPIFVFMKVLSITKRPHRTQCYFMN